MLVSLLFSAVEAKDLKLSMRLLRIEGFLCKQKHASRCQVLPLRVATCFIACCILCIALSATALVMTQLQIVKNKMTGYGMEVSATAAVISSSWVRAMAGEVESDVCEVGVNE